VVRGFPKRIIQIEKQPYQHLENKNPNLADMAVLIKVQVIWRLLIFSQTILENVNINTMLKEEKKKRKR
jgi:hypothetical protein